MKPIKGHLIWKKSRKEETTPQDILRVQIKFWKQKWVRACLEDWTRGSDKKLGWNCRLVVAMLVSIPHWHHQGELSSIAPGRSPTAPGSKDQGQFSCSDSLRARSSVLPSVGAALLCCPDEVPSAASGEGFGQHSPFPAFGTSFPTCSRWIGTRRLLSLTHASMRQTWASWPTFMPSGRVQPRP